MQPLGCMSHWHQCWQNPSHGASHLIVIKEEEKDLTAWTNANPLHAKHDARDITFHTILCSLKSTRDVLLATLINAKQELHVCTAHGACHLCEMHHSCLQVLKRMNHHPE